MESAITRVLKTTSRVTRKRTTKSNISIQVKENNSKRRRGRNMQKQQAALANSMKENCTRMVQQQQHHQGGALGAINGGSVVGGSVNTTTSDLHQQLVAPSSRLQSSSVPLNAKENVGQSISLSSSNHPMTRSRRQQQQLCSLQCMEVEVIGDCMDGGLNQSGHLGGGHMITSGALPPTIAGAPLEYAATTNGVSGVTSSYNGLTIPTQQPATVPTFISAKNQQQHLPVFEIHQTNPAASGIQLLQGGSLQPAAAHGFGMGGETFTPLPALQWTQASVLWRRMRLKDTIKVAPETELRLQHPGILPSMRVILLDWMMEVCEEYKLHRETYYLAVDLYDRFMDIRTNIQKEQLQLIGVTCLFIASKIEEIYPPKVTEFAYVTDGACTATHILDTELIICKVLNWKLNHHIVTVNTWVNTYMQLGSHHLRPSDVKAKEFEYPAYSGMEFVRVMQLLDLCMLDIASRQFSSSVLAASAVYLASDRSRSHLEVITGLELSDIHVCVTWMQWCAAVLSHKGPVKQRTFSGVIPQDSHNIQTHEVSISMLDDASELRKSQESMQSQYTTLLQDCSVFMTPPRPERKCLAPINTTC